MAESSNDLLLQQLRSLGLSVTAPRRKVFEALQNNGPLTVNALITHVPGVDRASVYRTIRLFEHHGVVNRLQVGWKYTLELSDAFSSHHHHATCLTCGKLIDLPENQLVEEQLVASAQARGFTLVRHQVELYGYCSECGKNT